MTAHNPPQTRPDTSRPIMPAVAAGTDWRHRAACRQDPEMWFPVGTAGPALVQIEQAKLVCRTACPVLDQCRAYALETEQEHGVWGGMSEQELRARLRGTQRRRYDNSWGKRPEPVFMKILREQRDQVLRLHGEGLSEWQIATRLGTNAQTIKKVLDILPELDALEAVTVGVAA